MWPWAFVKCLCVYVNIHMDDSMGVHMSCVHILVCICITGQDLASSGTRQAWPIIFSGDGFSYWPETC